METSYSICVNQIDFDLETDDPWEDQLAITKEDFGLQLNYEWASGRIYTVTANDEDDAIDIVMNEITEDSGWCIRGLSYEFVNEEN